VIGTLRAASPAMPILVLTGQGAEETAIDAFRRGASDYVVKGGGYLEALTHRVRGLVTT
jgi:DNA-binding response OmpR family regulator